MVFGCEDIDGAFSITCNNEWKGTNELHLTHISRQQILHLQIPAFEVPETYSIGFAMRGDQELISTECPSTQLLLSYIVDIPEHILS
jgi:hypothetical protein